MSYHDRAVHTGVIYKAAGWQPVPASGGGDWNHAGRRRTAQRIESKVRWERSIESTITQEKLS